MVRDEILKEIGFDSALKNMQIFVYLPDRDKLNEEVDNEVWLERMALLLTQLYSGCSIEQVEGTYYSTALDEVIVERSYRIFSYIHSNDEDFIVSSVGKVIELAYEFGTKTNQEKVLLVLGDIPKYLEII